MYSKKINFNKPKLPSYGDYLEIEQKKMIQSFIDIEKKLFNYSEKIINLFSKFSYYIYGMKHEMLKLEKQMLAKQTEYFIKSIFALQVKIRNNILIEYEKETDEKINNYFVMSCIKFLNFENRERNIIKEEEFMESKKIHETINSISRSGPLQRIPFIQKIQKFTCRNFVDKNKIQRVNASFYETMVFYNNIEKQHMVGFPIPPRGSSFSSLYYSRFKSLIKSGESLDNFLLEEDFYYKNSHELSAIALKYKNHHVIEKILSCYVSELSYFNKYFESIVYAGNIDLVKFFMQSSSLCCISKKIIAELILKLVWSFSNKQMCYLTKSVYINQDRSKTDLVDVNSYKEIIQETLKYIKPDLVTLDERIEFFRKFYIKSYIVNNIRGRRDNAKKCAGEICDILIEYKNHHYND